MSFLAIFFLTLSTNLLNLPGGADVGTGRGRGGHIRYSQRGHLNVGRAAFFVLILSTSVLRYLRFKTSLGFLEWFQVSPLV